MINYTLTDLSDYELLDMVKSGEKAADVWNEIFRRYGEHLMHYIFKVVKGRGLKQQDIEEILGYTFTLLPEKLAGLTLKNKYQLLIGPMKFWAKIAINRKIGALKKDNVIVCDIETFHQSVDDDSTDFIPVETEDYSDMLDQVMEVIDNDFTGRCQELLYGMFIEPYQAAPADARPPKFRTMREMSEITGMSIDAVAQSLFRCRKKLGRILKEKHGIDRAEVFGR